jgi:hypothetical protein
MTVATWTTYARATQDLLVTAAAQGTATRHSAAAAAFVAEAPRRSGKMNKVAAAMIVACTGRMQTETAAAMMRQ